MYLAALDTRVATQRMCMCMQSRDPCAIMGTTVVEWRPRRADGGGICAFTSAVGVAVDLLDGVTHNANWAASHGVTFTLFRSRLQNESLHPQWEKVAAAERMLARGADECAWLMHLDADATVVDVERPPAALLASLRSSSVPAEPTMFTTCNSPLGDGYDCDVFCCGRARQGAACCAPPRQRPRKCRVGLHDFGEGSPYPCMINSGVWFLQNGRGARELVARWQAKRPDHAEIFGEQAALNELKEAMPRAIDVVGAQVMNTPAAFHSRMLRSGELGRAAFDIALRHTSGFEPEAHDDKRLNQTVYARASLRLLGAALDSSPLKQKLAARVGDLCFADPSAFICHPFALPTEQKAELARAAAAARRPAIERRLMRSQQLLRYRSVDEAIATSSGGGGGGASASSSSTASTADTRSATTVDDAPPAAEAPIEEYTAVCLAGALRTFLQPPVQAAFASRLHHPGYEYFVSTDRPLPLPPEAGREADREAGGGPPEAAPSRSPSHSLQQQLLHHRVLLRPVRAWVTSGDGDGFYKGRPNTEQRDELPRGRCPRGTCNPFRFLHPFALRLQECYYSIQKEEAVPRARRHAPARRHGGGSFRYASVLRLRPDHFFVRRMPPVGSGGGHTHSAWMPSRRARVRRPVRRAHRVRPALRAPLSRVVVVAPPRAVSRCTARPGGWARRSWLGACCCGTTRCRSRGATTPPPCSLRPRPPTPRAPTPRSGSTRCARAGLSRRTSGRLPSAARAATCRARRWRSSPSSVARRAGGGCRSRASTGCARRRCTSPTLRARAAAAEARCPTTSASSGGASPTRRARVRTGAPSTSSAWRAEKCHVRRGGLRMGLRA